MPAKPKNEEKKTNLASNRNVKMKSVNIKQTRLTILKVNLLIEKLVKTPTKVLFSLMILKR